MEYGIWDCIIIMMWVNRVLCGIMDVCGDQKICFFVDERRIRFGGAFGLIALGFFVSALVFILALTCGDGCFFNGFCCFGIGFNFAFEAFLMIFRCFFTSLACFMLRVWRLCTGIGYFFIGWMAF